MKDTLKKRRIIMLLTTIANLMIILNGPLGNMYIDLEKTNPLVCEKEEIFQFENYEKVDLTAYNDHSQKTSSGVDVNFGYIAFSRDLAKKYSYGDRFIVYVEKDGKFYDLGIFEFRDLTHKRFKKRVDIFIPCRNSCLNFGIRRGYIVPYEE